MSIDFNALPFACVNAAANHRLSEQFVEFFEEPKLRIHKYGEINKPYLSNWFAITCDWFPERKYIVFDTRSVMDTSEFKLPYNNDEVLPYLGGAIVSKYGRLMDFLNKVIETKDIDGSEIEAARRKTSDNLVSKEWEAMQPVSRHFVSLFYQTQNVDDFIGCCNDLDCRFDESHLAVLWECLTEVCMTQNALLKYANE